MPFEDVYRISEKRSRVTEEEVATRQEEIGILFPEDYSSYITTFGWGIYNDLVMVVTPDLIAERYRGLQGKWLETSSQRFDNVSDLLSSEDLSQSLIIATTGQGDEVLFNSPKKDMYALPRQSTIVHRVGSNLSEALDWIVESGMVFAKSTFNIVKREGMIPADRFRYFEPFVDRVNHSFIIRRQGIVYDIQDIMLSFAHEHEQGSFCVVRQWLEEEDGDAAERQSCSLFVKEFMGKIECIAWDEENNEAWVGMSYDVDHQTDSLKSFIDLFTGLASTNISSQ